MARTRFTVSKGVGTSHQSGTSILAPYVYLPVGSIAMWPTTTIPEGWLDCDGTEKSISVYPELDFAIGGIYGARTDGSGNSGSTHFRVPDLRGRVIIGNGAGTGLTARNVSEWGGIESITANNSHITHNHSISPHTHTMNGHKHAHSDHGYFAHGLGHTHSIAAHSHTIGNDSNPHDHFLYFGNSAVVGTPVPRTLPNGTPLSPITVSSGGHVHPLGSSGTDSRAMQSTTEISRDPGSIVTGAVPTPLATSGGPSSTNTSPTGSTPVSIDVMQKTYCLKYIIKAY